MRKTAADFFFGGRFTHDVYRWLQTGTLPRRALGCVWFVLFCFMGPTFLDPTPSQHPYDHNPDWIRSPDTLDFAPARFNNRSVFPFHIPDLIEITPSFFAAQPGDRAQHFQMCPSDENGESLLFGSCAHRGFGSCRMLLSSLMKYCFISTRSPAIRTANLTRVPDATFEAQVQESSMTVMVLAPRSKRMMSGLVDERCLDVGKVNSVFHTLHDRLDLP
ncbi:hypothetical protein GEV33_003963 [Tenebrio molitor]|uniref:Uncharacterized protein n=1 Tax=Tenebrio molitor TaxID=7067 RepID=A0A8J6LGU6_TENMO|nr:hypothetical protein GEV33_003963 [Tenebrio molitor]